MDQEENILEPEKKHGWLISWLFDTNISIPKYVFRTGLISLIPSLFVSFLLSATGIINDKTGPEFAGPVIFNVIGMLIIGPPLETFLMIPILKVLSFITKQKIRLAIMSAFAWAILHSLAAPAWGLVIFWPFFVFSCCYLSWRQKSFWYAVLVTSCVHAFQNTLPTIAYIAVS